MKYGLFSLLIFITMLTGCKEEGDLSLNFVATYDNEPLLLGEDLNFLPEYNIWLLQSDFFISEIALTSGSEVTRIKDIDFVDFSISNNTLEDALAGFSLNYTAIPAGTYDGIRFGIGVPPSLNGMKPADFESESPLSKSGYHWEAWESFIFAKLGGKIIDDDGTGFFFHTGTNDLFRTLEFAKDLVIAEDNTEVVKITIDHKKLFEDSGGLFNIIDSPVNHNPLAIVPLEMLVNNYSSAFSFE